MGVKPGELNVACLDGRCGKSNGQRTLDLRRELPRYPVFELYGIITFSTVSTPVSTLRIPFDWGAKGHRRRLFLRWAHCNIFWRGAVRACNQMRPH